MSDDTATESEPCKHRFRTISIGDLLLGGLSVCELCDAVERPDITEDGESE